MGTGPFAIPSFEALVSSRQHDIPLVVTRPIKNDIDAKSKSLANPVRAWADQLGLSVIDPESINDQESISLVASMKPDLFVVCDYGQILSANALGTSRLGGVNLHGSLLPRHRGAAPVQWSILRGDSETGTCVIHMTPKLDGGPVISSVATKIGVGENAGELEKRLSDLGVQCLMEAVAKLARFSTMEECDGIGERQDSFSATPAPRLAKTDGQLDFRYPARLIDRQIRGLQPWPGVFGNIQIGNAKEMRVIIGRASLTGCAIQPSSKADHSDPSRQSSVDIPFGRIIWGETLREILASRSEMNASNVERPPLLAVACSDEFLEIEQIQPSGKKMQQARDFLAGYGKAESMHFVAPTSEIPHRLLEKMRISSST